MDATSAATGTLAFTIAGNNTEASAIVEKLDYAGGDEWLVADGDRTPTPTKASRSTLFKYKMAAGLSGMSDFRPVTIRLSNKASGKNLDIKVTPTALSGPAISLVPVAGSSYDAATNTVTIDNTDGQTFKLHAIAPTLSGEAGTTGSSVSVAGVWLTADPSSAATAEDDYTFTMATAQASPDETTTVTLTSAATSATTVVNVKLKTVIP